MIKVVLHPRSLCIARITRSNSTSLSWSLRGLAPRQFMMKASLRHSFYHILSIIRRRVPIHIWPPMCEVHLLWILKSSWKVDMLNISWWSWRMRMHVILHLFVLLGKINVFSSLEICGVRSFVLGLMVVSTWEFYLFFWELITLFFEFGLEIRLGWAWKNFVLVSHLRLVWVDETYCWIWMKVASRSSSLSLITFELIGSMRSTF